MAMEQEPRLGGAGSENFRSKNAGSVCECTGFVHIRLVWKGGRVDGRTMSWIGETGGPIAPEIEWVLEGILRHLDENLDDWLAEELDNYLDDDYLVLDCPGLRYVTDQVMFKPAAVKIDEMKRMICSTLH
ncbi:hypothetical protein FNV43_RR09850 [Rhamnella rubrinervis]|uniref:Uncharacterized protein n=1 Tax=Rhamnella rubrinervis TaxID=2594499 RepID=A0A8K0HB76_9ROSA|nr:hypothetical protein FNV43_RR09850 [Rhamnella rubrinervis]